MRRLEWLFGKPPTQDKPEFVGMVEQYTPTFENLNGSEKARENFRSALELFNSLCGPTQASRMSMEAILDRRTKEGGFAIEGSYRPQDPVVQGQSLRVRLFVPHFDAIALGTRDCVPALADADNSPPHLTILQHLAAQFIRKGIIIRVNEP